MLSFTTAVVVGEHDVPLVIPRSVPTNPPMALQADVDGGVGVVGAVGVVGVVGVDGDEGELDPPPQDATVSATMAAQTARWTSARGDMVPLFCSVMPPGMRQQAPGSWRPADRPARRVLWYHARHPRPCAGAARAWSA
jgi:hypothetical protein